MSIQLEKTRNIKSETTRELWARSAGRCQFEGHNAILYKSEVTQESVNLAQQAHIYSFSQNGPRGWGPFKKFLHKLNEVSNLMLMCHGCHQKIDNDKEGSRYSANLLLKWKEEHEKRIEIVTGIASDKRSHVILYGANIGNEKSPIKYHECIEAMFPDAYPATERPNNISMQSALKDDSETYWEAESKNLLQLYSTKILPLIEEDECKDFSIFALAPQPLLIKLGSILTDKIHVKIYQPQREPKGWKWQESRKIDFIVNNPDVPNASHSVALVFSLSAKISYDRITKVLGTDVDIWEISIEEPYNNFLRSEDQLSSFRDVARKLMTKMAEVYGHDFPIHIFPAMPVACALEIGRIRMPKAEMPWIIYDENHETKTFNKAIAI